MVNPVEKLRQMGQQKVKNKTTSPETEVKLEPVKKEVKVKTIKEPKKEAKIVEEFTDTEMPKVDPDLAEKFVKAVKLEEHEIKMVSSEHEDYNADFIEENLRVNINATPIVKEENRPKILLDEYDIPCGCFNREGSKFVSRYDCERCNPIKQEQRMELRKELVKQINSCKEKLLAMEAIDGIKIDERTGKQIKEVKDTRNLFQKMTGF